MENGGSFLFRDRVDAGKELGNLLSEYRGVPSALVLGLPRGGVPVGYEVARFLDVEFDILVVRKLGLPGSPEYAMGAICGRDARLLNEPLVKSSGITAEEISEVERRERKELARREKLYRGGRREPVMENRSVLIVDDGLATGFTMRVAIMAVREANPAEVVVAVPVAAPDSFEMLRAFADRVISVSVPAGFRYVGEFYRDFSPVSDEEVMKVMHLL
jgi:predicted phosphoribosyltransferase